jgi:hypothetical protein
LAATKREAKNGLNRSEKKKLAYFSSATNDRDSKPHSWNYLTFYVCPDFEKLEKQDGRDVDPAWQPGWNVFYDLPAVGHFVEASATVAGKFLRDLQTAYGGGAEARSSAPSAAPACAEPKPPALGDLAGFWNLDTGLGIRVQSVATDTAKDVVTRIDLRHVFELLPEPCRYVRQDPWMALYPDRKKSFGFPAERAFKFRDSQQAYAAFGEISEPDDEAYLQAIVLTEEARAAQRKPPGVRPDEFWGVRAGNQLYAVETPTETVCDTGETRVSVVQLAHRLTLCFRAGIADLGGVRGSGRAAQAKEKLSLFAVSDKARGVAEACTGSAVDWTHDYYEDREGVILDFTDEPELVRNGVQYFSTRLLLGFEVDPELERIVELGGWNNGVAPHEVGRNISIATGRHFVLHPTPPSFPLRPVSHKSIGVQFHPFDHFEYYEDASPTEQLLFTVYPLVTTADGVYDVIAKEQVSEDQLEQLKKIDSVGFVKIVLMYALSPYGALQLDRCYVDGIPVAVERAER